MLRNGTDEIIATSEELILEYIKPTKTVVAVVMPLTCAPTILLTQQTFTNIYFLLAPGSWDTTWKLVLQVDPSGHRTLGMASNTQIWSYRSNLQ